MLCDGDGDGDGWVGAGTIGQYIETIIDNVHVTVKNVHIRYEGPDFALGVALKSVSALPINKDRVVLEACANNPTAVCTAPACSSALPLVPPPSPPSLLLLISCVTFCHDKLIAQITHSQVHRVIRLEKFSVYMNTHKPSSASPASTPSSPATLSLSALADIFSPTPKLMWQYLLPPVSGRVYVTMQKADYKTLSKNRAGPKLDLNARLDAFGLSIEREQYHSVLALTAALTARVSDSFVVCLGSELSTHSLWLCDLMM